MTFEKRNRLADILEEAFGEAVCHAYEGWSEAQDGHGYDCEEMADQVLVPTREKFAASLRSLREEA